MVGLAAVPFSHAEEPENMPLGVEESMLLALENNFVIILERTKPLIGEENVKLAVSEFDPTLFGSLTAAKGVTPSTSAFADPEVGETVKGSLEFGVRQRLKQGASYELSIDLSQTETNSNYAGIDPEYSQNIVLSVSQPMLKGKGTDINTTKIIIAKNTRKMSDYEFSRKVMEILTRIQETYWDMVYLNKELAVQEGSLERAKDFLKRIKLKVEVGILAPIEIAAAEAVVAVREETLIGIRHEIDNTQDRFKALINKKDLPPGSDLMIKPKDEPVYEKVELNMEELKKKAFDNRPDYRQAILDIDNKRTQLTFDENQTKLSLDLEGAVKLKGLRGTGKPVTDFATGDPRISRFDGDRLDAFSDMVGGSYYDFSIGLVVEYPLYNRSAKSKVARSILERNIAQTRLLNLRQSVELEVLRAVRAVRNAEQRIEASKIATILAEKKLDAEMKKYDVGASTSFAVLEFQNDLAAEQSKEIKAVIDYLKALAQLEMGTGTVLKNHNITLATSAR